MSVFVLGALHLDVVVSAPRLPRLDETLRGEAVAYLPGGKGGNQAIAAARMGASVAMAGAVGSDGFAETLLDALDAAGVDRTRVARLPGASGMSVAILDAAGAYGAVIVSAANLAVTGDGPLPDGTGIVLLQNEVPDAANLAAARAARAAGARVILNAAPARPVAHELLALVDILVVNRGEAADLSCQPEDQSADAAEILADRGPAAVIVTLGAGGLLCRDRAGILTHPAFAVRAKSSHGAGDAFVGALAARLDAGDALAPALRFAQAAAALHVATASPDRGKITPEAVAKFARD